MAKLLKRLSAPVVGLLVALGRLVGRLARGLARAPGGAWARLAGVPTWALVAVLVALLAAAWWMRVEMYSDKPEYMGRQETSPGSGVWKCPDGYSDTSNNWDMYDDNEGAKQCRLKSAKGSKKAKFMRRKAKEAKAACGPRPATDDTCSSYKCKKSDGTYKWKCVQGLQRDQEYMGCSTDGVAHAYEVKWDGKNCVQIGKKPYGLARCCEGKPGGMDRAVGIWGHRTCPGQGRTEKDGC